MSTHSVNVVTIDSVSPHPNAERLAIAHVGGWQCVVGIDQFKPGDTAVYIEPDYVIDTTRPEFKFLDKKGDGKPHRLKAVRLRGALSFGLLIPVPPSLAGVPVGADVMEELGVTRYVPPIRQGNVSFGDMQELPHNERPWHASPKFDLENIQRYPNLIKPGEGVVVTEKIDGTNARYMFWEDKMYVGSRNRWLKPESDNVWTRILRETPGIADFCRAFPGWTLYGEIYGPIQALKYGQTAPKFAAFAAYSATTGKWLPTPHILLSQYVAHAPVIMEGPYDDATIKAFAEADSIIPGAPAGHMREGVVITPMIERHDNEIGRVSLKYISQRYWLDKNT